MTLLQLSLLGEFRCRSAGAEPAFPTRKVGALLVYLAASGAESHGRDKLAALLWGDRPETEARANLRKTISRLRAALPAAARAALIADAGQVAVRSDALEVDVLLFERLVADGTPETLERAAALYRGPFLEGFAGCGEEFDEWLGTERRRLDELLQQTLQRLLDHYVVTGGIDRAIQIALRLIAFDPLQESVHRALIRLYMYQDRVGSALDQYRRCRELLARELGVEPAPETEALKAELLRLLPADPAGREGVPERERDDLPERGAVIHAAARDRAGRRSQLRGRPSIAVLSFAGLEETAERHLGDGLAEDIATELGRFRELDVIAPTTALAYRDVAVPPEQIGAELGTAYVLGGGLRSWARVSDHGPAGRDRQRPTALGGALRLRDGRDLRPPGRRGAPHRREPRRPDRGRPPRGGQAPAAGRPGSLRSLVARMERPEAPRPGGDWSRRAVFFSRRWHGIRTSRAPISGSPWRT